MLVAVCASLYASTTTYDVRAVELTQILMHFMNAGIGSGAAARISGSQAVAKGIRCCLLCLTVADVFGAT